MLSLWRNARIATCDDSMTVFDHGAILTRDGQIEWVGDESALPKFGPAEVRDLGGAWVTPGLIDCHTHLVFAGTRATEYAERLKGRTYAEIARAGGGILSTMRAVRGASDQELFDESVPRLQALLAEGVTTIEIKSGYGLTLADEGKMLRVARALQRSFPVTVKTTLLAAHSLPPEFKGRADDYIQVICEEWMPSLQREGLVDAVDVFCESIGFTLAQSERLFDAAQALGLPVKMHAEQLSNLGAARWLPGMARCHATTWNSLRLMTLLLCRPRARWVYCCLLPSTASLRDIARPSPRFAQRARSWPLPRTATPGQHRALRCYWQ